MIKPTQAGWYADPSSSSGQLRYWDGQQWTSMAKPNDSGDLTSIGQPVTAPSYAAFSIAKIAYVVCDKLVKLSISIGVFFIMSIIPVMIFGGWKIGGVHVVTIGSFIAQCAVICALASAAIAMPILSISRKVMVRMFAAELRKDDEKEYSNGNLTKERFMEECKIDYLIWRLNNSTQNVAIFTWICSAFIVFILHDPLMTALGNPWADLITLVLISVLGFAISGLFIKLIMKKYEKEFPLEYEEAESTLKSVLSTM